jgi:bacteriocin biosynthesis cyclodehydratase domain-containing protein
MGRPLLPRHIEVWSQPPDSSGDEVLHFVTARRRVKIKGHSFREFEQHVIPLLDGRHTVEEIAEKVADVFAPQDLSASLDLLIGHNLLVDADSESLAPGMVDALAPQLAFFRELDADPAALQQRLVRSIVTIFGVGSIGAQTAAVLGAARVGTIRCVDDQAVSAADLYLSPIFTAGDKGANRAEVVVRRIAATAPEVAVSAHTKTIDTEAAIRELIAGSHFVIGCLDPGQSSFLYKINRACLQERIRWTSCVHAGTEVVLGPTVEPFETACYLCYKMRAVSCAANPEDGFAFEEYLDRRKRDDSGRREGLAFGAGLAANLVGLEAFKVLAGIEAPPAGRIIVLDLLDLTTTRHIVLRKPWCPACSRGNVAAACEPSTAAAPDDGHDRT